MTDEELKALIAGKPSSITLTIQTVDNGIVLTGLNVWNHPETGVAAASKQSQAVATTPEAAAESAKNFLVGGSFQAEVA